MPIQRLPSLLVNQIAAGEVIERPASVVKECVENAIDAGATRIDIAIEHGGRELVRIADNGCGIAFDEIALAVAPHATSKISAQEDLDAIATLGFRGEALASIASVSRMSILSRPTEAASAGLIEIEGDEVRGPRPAGGPVGTTITVRNLFFNTPARRKFLRTEQTETGRVVDIVENLALAHPEIAFTLHIDGRSALDVTPVADGSPRRRVLDVLGEEFAEQLVEFESHDAGGHGLRIWGMAGRPEIARGTMKHQRIFLNGRVIADRSISHAIKEAYRGLIEPSRYPTILIFLQINPSFVDVNVHPTKAEVRFRNQAPVHGAVLSAVRSALRKADLTPAFDLDNGHTPSAFSFQFTNSADSRGPTAESPSSQPTFADYFRRLNPVQKGFVWSEVKQALAEEAPELLEDGDMPTFRSAEQQANDLPTVRTVSDILQVHSSYIVTQDEQGIVIIDQHALHERVMFEKLRQRISESNLESQRLLMPATVEVDRAQADLLEELKPLLSRIGIEAEPIGPNAIAVHSFTSLLFERGVEPGAFMAELLAKAANEGLTADPEAALHETLDMMACKAAIKAGDRLAPNELAELLKHREAVERASNCPHGRPTSLRLTLRELERQFGRS